MIPPGESQSSSVGTTALLSSASDNQSINHKRPKRKNDKSRASSSTASVSHQRKGKGKLTRLPHMPLDILFEIFEHLHPSDLLRLSLVTQSFHQILSTKKSTSLWKTVLAKAPGGGAPPCPSDMTERGWAKLIFGTPYCQECGAYTKQVLYAIRRRMCRMCISRSQEFIAFQNLESRPDYFTVQSSLTYMMPAALFISSTFQTYVMRRADVETAYSEARSACEGLQDEAPRVAAMKAYVERKREEWKPFLKHVDDCLQWEERAAAEQAEEKAAIKSARRKDIIQRCKAMGYEEGDLADIWDVASVNLAQPLTDRAWKSLLAKVKSKLEFGKLERVRIAELSSRLGVMEDV